LLTKFMLIAFVTVAAFPAAQASTNNSNHAEVDHNHGAVVIARQPSQNVNELNLKLLQTKPVTLTSPDEQYIKFRSLTKTRKPDAAFPELLPQFRENKLAIESYLQGIHLTIFQGVCQQALDFFGPNGDNLNLPAYNVTHMYFATILGDYQRHSRNSDDGYLHKLEPEYLVHCVKTALATAMDKDFCPIGLFARFDPQRIRPAMYIAHGLYPHTIVSPDGNLSTKNLLNSLAHNIRLCAMPLTLSEFDGELEESAETFLAHDWGHASPRFNAIDKISQDGLMQYQALLILVDGNEDEKISNMDYFCLFFIEHEKYLFLRGDVSDFAQTCEDSLSLLLCHNLEVFSLSSISVDGMTTMDVFKQLMPSKAEPFTLEHAPEGYPEELTVQIFNSDFRRGYNLLFDIKRLLKESDVDFEIWRGDTFNVAGMTKTLTDVFHGFKQRYSGKFYS
jgi:hypothetical protein